MYKWLAGAAVAVIALPLGLLFAIATASVPSLAVGVFTGGPTALAKAYIPPAYLILYTEAAQTCAGLPWSVLAGIGKAESDHGRSYAPGVHSGSNRAGAEVISGS